MSRHTRARAPYCRSQMRFIWATLQTPFCYVFVFAELIRREVQRGLFLYSADVKYFRILEYWQTIYIYLVVFGAKIVLFLVMTKINSSLSIPVMSHNKVSAGCATLIYT